MKNIFLLPTDKPSRLYTVNSIGKLDWSKDYLPKVDGGRNQNIYITSDEEIKEGDWCICLENIFKNEIFKVDSDTPNKSSNVTLEFAKKYLTKIILTTDQELFKDGVQAIDDEFLEWFVKNPSCEEVEVIKTAPIRPFSSLYKIIIPKEIDVLELGQIIPKEEPKQEIPNPINNIREKVEELRKQETLEEAAEKFYPPKTTDLICSPKLVRDSFIAGAKWQQENSNVNSLDFEINALKREIKVLRHQQEQERMYSEEDMKQFGLYLGDNLKKLKGKTIDEIFEQFKKK